jgi:Nuclease-related domain
VQPELSPELELVIVAVVAVLLVGIVGRWLYVFLRRRSMRRRSEATIASIAYDVLRNVLVPNGMGGHIHLHYLLLTERGLLVIDVVDAPGAVFGGDQMTEWTAIGPKRRYTFQNPQHALYDRMAAVQSLAGEVPVEGRIVFSMRSEFPKGKPRYVVRIDGLQAEFSVVDASRISAAAAFADVWQKVKSSSEPNPLAA